MLAPYDSAPTIRAPSIVLASRLSGSSAIPIVRLTLPAIKPFQKYFGWGDSVNQGGKVIINPQQMQARRTKAAAERLASPDSQESSVAANMAATTPTHPRTLK